MSSHTRQSTIKNQEFGTVNKLRNALEHPVAKLTVIAGIGIAALTGCSQENTAAAPKATHSATVEAKPSASPTASPEATTSNQLEFKKLEPNMTPQQIAETVVNDLNASTTGALTESNYNQWLATPDVQSGIDYLKTVGQRETDELAQNLFGETWQAKEKLYLQNLPTQISSIALLDFQTHDPNNNVQDLEPYKVWTTIDKVTASTPDSTTDTVTIEVTDHDNSSENRAATLNPGSVNGLDGTKSTITTTITKASGAVEADNIFFRLSGN